MKFFCEQLLVAVLLRARAVHLRLVARQIRLGLLQRRLEWPRSSWNSTCPLRHSCPSAKATLTICAVHARLERDRGVGLDVADRLYAHRDRFRHDGGGHHRHGATPFTLFLRGGGRLFIRAGGEQDTEQAGGGAERRDPQRAGARSARETSTSCHLQKKRPIASAAASCHFLVIFLRERTCKFPESDAPAHSGDWKPHASW